METSHRAVVVEQLVERLEKEKKRPGVAQSKTRIRRYHFNLSIGINCPTFIVVVAAAHNQCDQKKINKCLQKLPQNDFTRKMIDFDTFTKIA